LILPNLKIYISLVQRRFESSYYTQHNISCWFTYDLFDFFSNGFLQNPWINW